MLTRMGSNLKQKTKGPGEESQELPKTTSCDEAEQKFEDLLQVPNLSLSGLHVPADRPSFPCGSLTEIQSAEYFHSPVILKREKQSSNCGSSVIRKELRVLMQIHHPNILLLMGTVKLDSNITTVFEDASKGTLHYLLHRKKITLSPMEIQKLLTQLCQVMMFLHERGWLHLAITSHSILITANSTLKLTGFETARKLNTIPEENSITKYLMKQWFHWQSPELLGGQAGISTESDVFSVGLISWEMCTNAEPWFGYTYDELLMKYKSLNCVLETGGLQLPFVNPKQGSFFYCMQQMLQIDPKRRISNFLDVLSNVHKLQAQSISTSNTITDHNQPVHFIRSIEKAHLLFQPQPQKTMLASSKQKHLEERDPYTGLKRVSNSWQKINRKSPSTTSINIGNLYSFTKNDSGQEINNFLKLQQPSTNKLHVKNQLPPGNNKTNSNKIQNHYIQQSQNSSNITNKSKQGDISTLNVLTQKNMQKYNTQPSSKHLFISDAESHLIRPVPIKPASHLNQRTVNFKNNVTNSISKEQNIQHGITCLKSSGRNVPLDNTNWKEVATPKLHHDIQFQHLRKEKKRNSLTPTDLKSTAYPKYLPDENSHCQSERKQKKTVTEQSFEYVNQMQTKITQSSEENDSQKDHETCNSDTESKENGFESTDSGIFTISREFDQNILNQLNSTEDLYIDDEFCLEMQLDSHMQLLCLFDNTCEYNEDFIDDLQPDLKDDRRY